MKAIPQTADNLMLKIDHFDYLKLLYSVRLKQHFSYDAEDIHPFLEETMSDGHMRCKLPLHHSVHKEEYTNY